MPYAIRGAWLRSPAAGRPPAPSGFGRVHVPEASSAPRPRGPPGRHRSPRRGWGSCGSSVLLERIEEVRCPRDRIELRPLHQVFSISSLGVTALPVIQCCAPLGAPGLSEDEADELERVFKALADRHRVKILNRLLGAGGEAVCVCEFEDLLGLKQSTVSYHLKQLLD